MSVLSPNMSLVLPTIGVDSGLIWEQSVNTNSGILDGHNHSVGSGIQINPSGININTDLPFNGFNATSERSTRFNAQISPLALPTDLGCIYVSGADLYFNDINGNQVRITSGGTVNATSSGISSGTATAAFSSSTLVVDAASNTPANIQVASVLLGNTGVSGSNYLTLSPPSALSSNYSLTLPPLPAQTNVMTLDTSGNMSSITYDQVGQAMTSVGANAIGTSMTASGANAVANSRTRATNAATVGAGGIAISGSSGNFNVTNTSYINVTGQSVTITTTGRPVMLMMVPDGSSSNAAGFGVAGGAIITIQILNTTLSTTVALSLVGATSSEFVLTLNAMDIGPSGAPGTYTYQIQAKVNGGTGFIQFAHLVAYEL